MHSRKQKKSPFRFGQLLSQFDTPCSTPSCPPTIPLRTARSVNDHPRQQPKQQRPTCGPALNPSQPNPSPTTDLSSTSGPPKPAPQASFPAHALNSSTVPPSRETTSPPSSTHTSHPKATNSSPKPQAPP